MIALYKVSITIFFINLFYFVSFSEEITSNKKIENVTYEINLDKIEGETLNSRISLKVKYKITNKTDTVSFASKIDFIEKIDFVEPYFLLIKGNLIHSIDILDIIDLDKKQFEFEIWHHTSYISPHKRYLLYETAYPRMAGVDQSKLIMMILDLKDYDNVFMDTKDDLYPNYAVGWPIYPLDIRLENNAFQFEKVDYISPPLWSPDESSLFFITAKEWDKDYQIVCADLKKGFEYMTVKVKEFDVNELINWDEITEFDKNRLDQSPIPFGFSEIVWLGSKRVRLIPNDEYYLKDSFEIDISDILK